MIAVIDYGLGNLRSVVGALTFLGAEAIIASCETDLMRADKLVLPGVGSFRTAMENIDERALRAPILRAVTERKLPILGICLGMQLLATEGEEDGRTPGLGLVPGVVRHLDQHATLPLPHIGFNEVVISPTRRTMFEGMRGSTDFYFVHSYHLVCHDDQDVSSRCSYGSRFTASIERGNIFGVQFHPEKSQTNGLRLIQNFVRLPVPC